MKAIAEEVTMKLGDGHLTVPVESLVKTWLKSMTEPPAMLKAVVGSVPRIGAQWPGQGGVYAGVIKGEAGQPDYHLIVPTDPAASIKDIVWGVEGTPVPGAEHEYDGFANTIALMRAEQSHPAAEWAADLEIEELCDFYLPSRRELRLMWVNVPDLFEDGWYWSSTQYAPDPSYAWLQLFTNGFQDGFRKSYAGRARAVRRLVI